MTADVRIFFFFFFFPVPDSHSCCWEPHMLIISLNTSHHLTQQTVVLLTDPIHGKGGSKERSTCFSSIHFLPVSSLHASPACCLPPSLPPTHPAPLIPPSVQSHRRIDWTDAFRPCPLSSSSWLELERERRGGRWWGYLSGSLRLMSLD